MENAERENLMDQILDIATENAELLEALEKIGVLMCDKTVGDMVKNGIITDGLCEEGETETGLALIVLGHLFREVQEIKNDAIKKARD